MGHPAVLWGRDGIIADVAMDRKGGTESVAEMVARLRSGEVRALARAVSLVEDGGPQAEALVRACRGEARASLRIGVTGPPGVGKSTLVDQMIRSLREQGRTVAVLAVDPSSPVTGGALLGDRIRMQGFAGDTGVYIRSMASRGMTGGLARAAEDVCEVMEAAGREVLLIETVGVGQAEVEVAGLADVTVLVLMPGMGDEVQSLKAGVMEMADVFVVNKSDREGADLVEASLLETFGERAVPVVRTIATTGGGVAEFMAAVMRVYNPTHDDEAVMNGAPDRLGRVIPNRGIGIHRQAQRKPEGYWIPVLDHLGVAVKSIAAAKGFYELLGLQVEYEETVEHEQVRVAMLPLGESRIELLEATAEDSVIGRFLAKRGEGLHHVAVRVPDVDAMFARLQGEGVCLGSEGVRVGAGGHRYFFGHPASTGGVLVEIVGEGEV